MIFLNKLFYKAPDHMIISLKRSKNRMESELQQSSPVTLRKPPKPK
jgi:hypothetical protein